MLNLSGGLKNSSSAQTEVGDTLEIEFLWLGNNWGSCRKGRNEDDSGLGSQWLGRWQSCYRIWELWQSEGGGRKGEFLLRSMVSTWRHLLGVWNRRLRYNFLCQNDVCLETACTGVGSTFISTGVGDLYMSLYFESLSNCHKNPWHWQVLSWLNSCLPL